MLGLPNEMVWRTELSCGTVALLQSDNAPTGVLVCEEHGEIASIVATIRWDRYLADRRVSRADSDHRIQAEENLSDV